MFNVPHLFITRLLDRQTCASFSVDSPVVLLYSWLSILLNALVPFTLLLLMNTGIIVAIRDRGAYFGDKVTAQLWCLNPVREDTAVAFSWPHFLVELRLSVTPTPLLFLKQVK